MTEALQGLRLCRVNSPLADIPDDFGRREIVDWLPRCHPPADVSRTDLDQRSDDYILLKLVVTGRQGVPQDLPPRPGDGNEIDFPQQGLRLVPSWQQGQSVTPDQPMYCTPALACQEAGGVNRIA